MSGFFGGGNALEMTINQSEQVAAGVQIQTSAYGLVLPIIYGRTRTTGNLLWYGDFTPIPHTTTTSSGGGGGGKGGGSGGGVTQSQTTYTYNASFAFGIGEGPMTAFNAAWASKDYFPGAFVGYTQNQVVTAIEQWVVPYGASITILNAASFVANTSVVGDWNGDLYGQYSVSNGVYTFDSALIGTTVGITYTYAVTIEVPSLFTSKLGTYPQTAWSYLTSNHPLESLAMPGVAYAAASNYLLPSGTSLPNLSFDVTGRLPYNVGTIDDANPKDIVVDFITNANYGAAANFPLGNMTQFSNYCIAGGMFLSPAFTTAQPANQTLDNLFKLVNCGAYFSEGVLKVVPYSDTSQTNYGVTYTANVTPLYDLTDDDFAPADNPVRMTRGSIADAYNQVTVEFLNRANQYNIETVEAKDLVHIDTYGLRPMQVVQAHEIADINVARMAAQAILQRSLYIRGIYEFEVSWRYVGVEPTDYLTLTDTVLGLSRYPVRVLSTEEADEGGGITMTCEDAPAGVLHMSLYTTQAGGGYGLNLNAPAGATNTPIVFEAPVFLTATGYELWLAACGQVIAPISGKSATMPWGGCQVWVSQDNETYAQVGVITNPARMGVLTANFPAGTTNPDLTSTLSVNLTVSGGTLSSGTQADADNANTLCYVDGEYVSFTTATLTAANRYDMNTYLQRGQYKTTQEAHLTGTNFVRIDQALFKYAYTPDRIGTTLYIKLPSFNIFGGGVQGLGDVAAFSFYISNAVLLTPLDPIANASISYLAGIMRIIWDRVIDFRVIDYEVRFGATASSATVLGRVSTPEIQAMGNSGNYWIATHYQTPDGINLYSTWTEVIITGAVLTKNIIAEYEQSPAWAGNCSGYAIVSGVNVILNNDANWLAIADFLNDPNIFAVGNIQSPGTYTVPTGNQVNIGRVAPCTVSMTYTVRGASTQDNWLGILDFLNTTDLFFESVGPSVSAQPQIRTADHSGNFGNWQNYIPGQYNAQYFDARINLTTSDTQAYPVLSQFDFLVDVPDRTDSYTSQAISSGGSTITYNTPFNGGPGGGNQPNVQITILGATAGDDIVTSNSTLSSVTVQIVNTGNGVARNINLIAQGY